MQKSAILKAYSVLQNTYMAENQKDSTLIISDLKKNIQSSIYNESILNQLQEYKIKEFTRQEQLFKETKEAVLQRKIQIQYSIIVILIILLASVLIFYSNSVLANSKTIEFTTILIVLFGFEFINLVFHPIIENISDPIVKSFWAEEFANYTDRYTQEATPAIQNKIGQFTSNPLIRNIVGQPKSSFDLRKMMDEKKIIIMNLSKGRVGEVNANLLGSMLVTKIYLAAMSRAVVPARTLSELPSFYFYVDEFQSFANQIFADILSEALK